MHTLSKVPRSPNSEERLGDSFPHVAQRTQYFNNWLDRKVYVLDGFGNLMTIARSEYNGSKKPDSRFTITNAYFHNSRCMTEQIEDNEYSVGLINPLDLNHDMGVPGLKLSQTVEFDLSELLTHDIIKDATSGLYISLSRRLLEEHSRGKFENTNAVHEADTTLKSSLALNLVIIDNREEAPKQYYVNLAGRVFAVPVTKNPGVDNGVWIESNRRQVGAPAMEYQTLKDSVYHEAREVIPPVTLFNSSLEASRFGDVEAELNEKVKQRESELVDLKHKLEISKAVAAKEKAELEEKQNRRKDYYDERSSKRRDDSDKIGIVAKTIGAVVAVAGAIVGFLRWTS